MRVFFLFFLLFFSFIKAQEIEEKTLIFEQLKTLEKGIKKDFYINEYLKLDTITPQEAFDTLSLIDDMTPTLFHNFAKRFKNDETLAVSQCMQTSLKDLIYSYPDCIAIGFNINRFSTLSTYDLKILQQNLQDKYPNLKKVIKILLSAIPFTKLITSDANTFYDIFLNVNTKFRQNYFNYKLPNKTVNKIKANPKMYNKIIQTIILDTKLTNLQQNLENLDLNDLEEDTKFLLSLYYINKNDLNKAYEILNTIIPNTNYVYEEKVNFFKYLITKDENLLKDITSMNKSNIYSFYETELLHTEFIQENLPKLEDIDKRDDLSKNDIALLYATIKTKSDFNDSLISKDFNLGLTQLDIKNIIKVEQILNQKQSLIKQFETQTNIEYFINYLKSIQTEVSNPVKDYLNIYNKFLIDDFDKGLNPFIKLEFLSFLIKDFDKFLINYYFYYNYLNEEKIKADFIFQML